jgi:hypothetical protein
MEPPTTIAPTRDRSALEVWRRDRQPELAIMSELAGQATSQAEVDLLTRAYVLVLAGEFQAFFTDLLSDVAKTLVSALPDDVLPPLRKVLQNAIEDGHLINFRNPDTTTLQRDLVRFDFQLRERLSSADRRRLRRLDEVIRTRNKLAHATATVAELGPGGARLTPATVDEWRRDLDQLVTILNKAVASDLRTRLSATVPFEEAT